MLSKLMTTTAFVIAGTAGAFAQGFTGGSVGIEYSDFDELEGLAKTTFSGSAEFAITPQFSVAGSLSTYNYEDQPDDVELYNYTVHAIYNLNSDVSLGAFAGRDRLDFGGGTQDVDNYGIEAAYVAGPVELQGYVGTGDAEGTDLTYFGISTDYGLGNGFSVLGAYDLVDVDDEGFRFSTIEFGGAYTFGSGPSVFAKVGQVTFETGGFSNDDNYFAIGATFGFGAKGGTTFKPVGYLEQPLIAG